MLRRRRSDQSANLGHVATYPEIRSEHERRRRMTLWGAAVHPVMAAAILHWHVLHAVCVAAGHFRPRHAVHHVVALANEGLRCTDRRKCKSKHTKCGKDEPDHLCRI